MTDGSDAPGAWLVYDYSHGPYAISLHESAPVAARKAARQGYGKVGYWPFDLELSDAVDAWEGRVNPPAETQADYLRDGSPEAVAVVREARGLPPLDTRPIPLAETTKENE